MYVYVFLQIGGDRDRKVTPDTHITIPNRWKKKKGLSLPNQAAHTNLFGIVVSAPAAKAQEVTAKRKDTDQ